MAPEVHLRRRNQSKVQGWLGWVTLALVLLAALPFGAVYPSVWLLYSLVFLACLAIQIGVDLVSSYRLGEARLWPLLVLFFGVLVWLAIQTFPTFVDGAAHPVWQFVPQAVPRISADPVGGYHGILRYVLYFCVFWIVLRAAQDAERAMLFLKTIALSSTVLALFGLWAALAGTNPIVETQGEVVQATFINRNSYATFAIFGALANLGVYLHVVKSLKSQNTTSLRDFLEAFFSIGWIYFLGTVFCLAALLGTLSRAGAGAGGIALLVFFWLHFRGGRADAKFGLPVVIGLFGYAALFLSAGVMTRFLATAEDSLRFQIYPQVWQAILDRPVLGHGLGSFADVFRSYVPVSAARLEWHLAHNSYLENAFEMGLPAAGVFYAVLVGFTLMLLRGNLLRKRHRTYSNVALAAIAGSAFHSVFDFSLQIPAITLLFVTLCAIGWAHATSSRE